jgi:23S rRNA (guanosine2251-2'-O)-methyltransferase
LEEKMNQIISGKNAVIEAIKAGITINRVLIADNIDAHFVGSVLRLCREYNVPVRRLPKHKLSQLAGEDHRGIAAEIASATYAEVSDLLDAAAKQDEPPLLILLDGVEDPHNLGAIIRSAYCLGAHGVIIGNRRSAQLTQTVMKTSAGAAARLPVARVTNLNQTLTELKEAGCWIAAVDMDGQNLWKSDLSGPLVLVLGGEGTGVSPLLKHNCDLTLAIPMCRGEIGSLNVSNAAAIILSEAAHQRKP